MKRTFFGLAALALLLVTAESAKAQFFGGSYSTRVGDRGRITVGVGNGGGYYGGGYGRGYGYGNGYGGGYSSPYAYSSPYGYGQPFGYAQPYYAPTTTSFYYGTPSSSFYYSNRPRYRWGW